MNFRSGICSRFGAHFFLICLTILSQLLIYFDVHDCFISYDVKFFAYFFIFFNILNILSQCWIISRANVEWLPDQQIKVLVLNAMSVFSLIIIEKKTANYMSNVLFRNKKKNYWNCVVFGLHQVLFQHWIPKIALTGNFSCFWRNLQLWRVRIQNKPKKNSIE